MTINNSIFVHRTATIKLVKTPSETDDHEYASIDITITDDEGNEVKIYCFGKDSKVIMEV